MNQTLSRKPVSSQASHLRFTTRELVLGGMFAALMAVISQLSIPMPNGVPITIQVFGIALIGVTLGWRLGCLSAVIYLLIGAVGLPVFANFGGGISRLVSLTGGYLWSYPLMAALCGIHPNTGNQKKDTALVLLSSLAGLLLVETIGGLQCICSCSVYSQGHHSDCPGCIYRSFHEKGSEPNHEIRHSP